MASEYGTCPICMEDYDLDIRIPKSLDCRHSLCKLCLMNKTLNSCPICRQPVMNPDNIPNDFTMTDYLHHKQQNLYLKEEEATRKRLGHLIQRAQVKIGHIENLHEEHNLMVEQRETLFREYTKSLFETCLKQCSLKDAVKQGASLMAYSPCFVVSCSCLAGPVICSLCQWSIHRYIV